MGQHSYNPPRPNSTGRSSSQAKRRWAAVAAGAAVVAAASTTAWAAAANEDAPKPVAMDLPPAPGPSSHTTTANSPTTTHPSKSTTGQVKSDPEPKTSRQNPPAESVIPTSPNGPKVETVAAVAARQESKPQRKAKKPKAHVISTGTCGASYYAEGQMTASGERFNPSAMTAAHRTLPMGSRVRVTNRANGDSVTVRINDRGPYVGGRCLDLSRAAFAAIGKTSAGVMRVKYEVLSHS